MSKIKGIIFRRDLETVNYTLPNAVPGVTVAIQDWFLGWPDPVGATIFERAFIVANNGFVFIQRGKVLITDRLHGHIFATLMDMPHVLLDNRYGKVSSYHKTWTKNYAKAVRAETPQEALEMAVKLLKKYNSELPEIPYNSKMAVRKEMLIRPIPEVNKTDGALLYRDP